MVQELCVAEVMNIKETENLARLRLLVGDTDAEMQEAMENGLRERGQGHLVEQFKLVDAASVEIGDVNENGRVSLGHVVRKFEDSGTSVVRIGNRNS